MASTGQRIGPYQIGPAVHTNEPGLWFSATRADLKPMPNLLLVLNDPSGSVSPSQHLKTFKFLESLADPRLPLAIAYFEGENAFALQATHQPTTQLLFEEGEPLDLATTLDLAIELSEIIQKAHQKGRHHGHLSPKSIVVQADGALTFWGFGSGASTLPPESWLAPERARGEMVSGATDQWSLAALVVGLLSGRAPWSGPDRLAEARRGLIKPLIDPIAQRWPGLGRLLRRMLDPKPSNRFPSIHVIRQELLAFGRKADGTVERTALGLKLHALLSPPEAQPQLLHAAPTNSLSANELSVLLDKELGLSAPSVETAPPSIGLPVPSDTPQVPSVDLGLNEALPKPPPVCNVEWEDDDELSTPAIPVALVTDERSTQQTVVPDSQDALRTDDFEETESEDNPLDHPPVMIAEPITQKVSPLNAPPTDENDDLPTRRPISPIVQYTPWLIAGTLGLMVLTIIVQLIT